MSATIEQSTFARYFSNPPVLSIPGRTFPVADYYLEDIITTTNYQPKSAKASRNYSKDEQDDMRNYFIQQGISDPGHLATLGMLSRTNLVDFDLLAIAVSLVLDRLGKEEGAILVFVSGVSVQLLV